MSEPAKRPGLFQYEWVATSPLLLIAMIGLLAAIAIPIFNTVQMRARVAKAQADVNTIADAVIRYRTHTGQLPAALTDLTLPTANAKGVIARPFLSALAVPPAGWPSEYRYAHRPDGTFAVGASGDGTTVSAPAKVAP